MPFNEMPIFAQNARILFQGDSITDGNRGRSEDPNHILGHGYAFIIAAKFGALLPERNLTFINRGVSGDKVTNLAERWQTDTLELQPDVLSILVGVNDLLNNVPAAEYERGLDELLRITVEANLKVRLVLGEPFMLAGESKPENWQQQANLQLIQEAVARLAEKYGAPLVRFQRAFDEAARRAPAEYWIWDTVHPTYAGHQIMADEWIRTVQSQAI